MKKEGKCKEYSHRLLQWKTIEITTKHPILCSSINNMWGKIPENHQQASGTCWEKGVLGGVYRLRNAWKNTKNITEPVTKWVNSKRCGLNRGASPPDPPLYAEA